MSNLLPASVRAVMMSMYACNSCMMRMDGDLMRH